MQYLTDDTRIAGMQEVTAPAELISQIPVSPPASELVFSSRRRISDIVHGRDKRLLVVIGPCSIHDPKAGMEYAARLREQAQKYEDQLHVIMRVYFEKPRTKIGWKGLINDPRMDNSYRINEGCCWPAHCCGTLLSWALRRHRVPRPHLPSVLWGLR